jgi:uncharacterized protein (DUF433 family)
VKSDSIYLDKNLFKIDSFYNKDYYIDISEKEITKPELDFTSCESVTHRTAPKLKDRKKFLNDLIKYFYKEVANEHKGIQSNNSIMSGMPVIDGTRIPITTIIQYLADGEDKKALSEDFELTDEEYVKALNYLIDILGRPYYE